MMDGDPFGDVDTSNDDYINYIVRARNCWPPRS